MCVGGVCVCVCVCVCVLLFASQKEITILLTSKLLQLKIHAHI